MKKYLAILSVLMVVACTTPETPAQTVFLIQSDYAIALRAEIAYANLPRCTTPRRSLKLCSTVEIFKKLRKADDAAWDGIKAAQTAVRTPGFGESKVTTAVASARALTDAFVNITDTLEVQ